MNYDAHTLLWENIYAKIKQIDYFDNCMTAFRQVASHSALLVIVKGQANVTIEQTPYQINQFCLFHIGKSNTLHFIPTTKCTYYFITYRGEMMYVDAFTQHLYMEHRPFHCHYSCVPANPIAIEHLLENMYMKWKKGLFQEHLFVKAAFYQLMYFIFEELTEGQGKPHEVDLAESARLYLERHLYDAVTVQQLATSLNISTRHLLRVFKERYGIGPQRYLQQARLTKAQNLLQNPSLSIKEIATALGYEDEYYFSRTFKKCFQLSPSTYRLKYSSITSDLSITSENHFQYNKNQLVQANCMESRKYKLEKQNFIQRMKVPFMISLLTLLVACDNERRDETMKETRVITDATGREVEIPQEPKKIVMQGNAIGDLFALDLEPIGVDRRFIETGVLERKEKIKASDIGFPTNFEQVLSLKPDLIMLSYVMDNEVEIASKIAPTVTFEGALPLKERFAIVADIVGKKEEGQLILKEYEEDVVAMWQKLYADGVVAEGETAVILQYFWNKSMYVMKTGGVAELLYHPTGLAMDDKVQALQPNNGPYIEIAEESMHDLLIGDHLFVLLSADVEAKKVFETLQQKPLWKSLPAVQNKKVHYIEDRWNYTDMTTSMLLVREFPNMLQQSPE